MTASDAWRLVADLNAPGSGAWQGACQNKRTGEWFLAHSRGSYLGRSAEEVHIYRFSKSGRYLDKMICVDAGHVYGFGVSDSNIVWLTWDGPDGNDVVTITYRPGRTMHKRDASKMHVFSEHSTQVSFSPTRAGLVCCEKVGADRYRFTKRLKADVLDNRDEPQGEPFYWNEPDRTWLQGFSVAGEHIYICCGKTDQPAWIEKRKADGGRLVGKLDITSAGPLPGESLAGAHREPEGMDARTFSVKIFTGTARRLRVYQLNDF